MVAAWAAAFYCPPMPDSAALQARVILVTAPGGEDALRLARALVGDRLAACVNVLPGATSVYRWRGRIHEEGEALLVVKTAADRVAELERRLADLHPYEVPELVVLGPVHVEARYLAWLCEQVAGETRSGGEDPPPTGGSGA